MDYLEEELRKSPSPSMISHKSELAPDPDAISFNSEKHTGDHLGVKEFSKVCVGFFIIDLPLSIPAYLDLRPILIKLPCY